MARASISLILTQGRYCTLPCPGASTVLSCNAAASCIFESGLTGVLHCCCSLGFLSPAARLSSSLAEGLRPLLEPLGQLLYDLLRPRFVQLADLDTLAELIDILQHEVLRDQLLRRAGPGGEALLPSLSRSLADLQERLIYR